MPLESIMIHTTTGKITTISGEDMSYILQTAYACFLKNRHTTSLAELNAFAALRVIRRGMPELFPQVDKVEKELR